MKSSSKEIQEGKRGLFFTVNEGRLFVTEKAYSRKHRKYITNRAIAPRPVTAEQAAELLKLWEA